MSKTTKVNVIKIDTDPAITSLKDLRKQLKDFKDEMTNLDEGSDEFLEIAQKAGELKHQIDEINESIKGASSDFGDMVGNITNVTAGLTGAFQAVAGGLQAIGIESEAIDKTIVRMQGLMAVTDGLSKIDTGIKSFSKLSKAIQGSSTAMKAFKVISNPIVLGAIAAAVVTIGAVWNKWGDSIRKNLPWLDEWIKKLNGTTDAELERLRERQDAFNEYYEKIQKAAEDIREKRALEVLKPEVVTQIQNYKDDIVLLEAEIAKLQNLMNNTSDRSVWDGYNQQALGLMEQVRLLKHEINDLYNNPIYRRSEEDNSESDDSLAKQNELLDIRIEKLKHSGKTEKEIIEETIKIEKERLDLYRGKTKYALEYERIETSIYQLQENLQKQTEETTEADLAAKAAKAEYELEGKALLEKQIEIENERLTLLEFESAEYWKQMAVIKALNEELTAANKTTDENLERRKDYLRSVADEYLMIEKRELDTRSEYNRVFKEIEEARKLDLINDKEQLQAKERLHEIYTKNVLRNSLSIVSSTSQMITGLLDGLADQQDKNNREGFEKSKKLQIASATIQMLTGITTALAGAFTTKSGPWDIALAAIQAATIATTGALNINKIKKTTFENSGGSASVSRSAVSATIIPPVQYSAAVQGASTEGAIKNTKVYVTETDITNTANKVSVQETENTY